MSATSTMNRKHVILFVDDEVHMLASMRRLFRRESYEILTASSAAEGLDLLRDRPVSVIVSDQRMPEMGGAEFLHNSLERSPHSVRIILTGHADIEAAVQAINEGEVYRYVAKPWGDEELKGIIRAAAQRFELEESNRNLTAQLQDKNAELEAFNSLLEKRVEERTHELRVAYDENLQLTETLRLKVKELEGRDRITQHLLTVHSLQDTLDLVLRVISDTFEMDRAVIYLLGQDGLTAAAALGVSTSEIESTPAQRQAFTESVDRREPVNVTDPQDPSIPPFAVIPIVGDTDVLGLIEVDRSRRGVPLHDTDLQALASFAPQVAIALNDSQIQDDYASWQGQLDSALKRAEEVDPLNDI